MAKPLVRVAVTGGAGQIAYSLLFRIASGEMFGADQPLALHILEIPDALKMLEGVQMELQDCAFPLLRELHIGSDPQEIFRDVHWALLVGAKPRGPGMERADLLQENSRIFIEQGKALNAVADRNVKVVVVGNPCNTNCWIAMQHAPRIPRAHFHAMMRLDENRARSQLAQKAGVGVDRVTHLAVWGNHSATQVPDYLNARIGSASCREAIADDVWLQGPFFSQVQKRGAAIIAARGKSSAASAASALVDAVKSLITPTPAGSWFSSAVCSDRNPYGIAEGLIFSFPCRSKGDGSCEIVGGLKQDPFLRAKIELTQAELMEERTIVMQILGGKKP